MRALGYSLTPMLLTVFGTCVLRLGWVSIFERFGHTFHNLLIIYPVTWSITGTVVIIAALIVQHKVFKKKPRAVEA